MPFKVGPLELTLILVIVLVIFGAGKLPEIGKALGKGIRQFKKSQEEDDEAEDKKSKTASTTVAKSSISSDKHNGSESDSP